MKKFSTSIRGYTKDEVNAFVSEVTKNYEEMLITLKNRDKEIIALQEKLTYYTNLESTLNRAILVAEDASNQIKHIAHEEATLITEEAKKNASRIINNALLKAERTEEEAETLRRKVAAYKRRIKQIIEEQLEMIDEVDEMK